ncbi:ComEA family DNA-binding protein [uncultured Flavonifractor sp.]|uniref:ComEA family DNA-binding protein n=1 Tax=uncultured Flavonifractor sp. TaxID=1193534 RepID=UPI0026307959|nr:ComEA family DNA-binding protein [uncultured Flavonifractor sp.]
MIKISKLEFASILLAAAFLAFTGGWFLRGINQAGPVRVEVQRTLTQESPLVLTPPPAGQSAGTGLVDLNTATAEELMSLPGIGEKRAAAIVAYREANGPFRIPEDLTRVDGIGEGILEGLIDQVTVSQKEDAP